MKICFVGDSKSIHLIEWTKFFRDLGHDVYLISDNENYIEGVKTFNVGQCLTKIHIPFFSATLQIIRKICKIKKIIKKIEPELVHSHYATNYGFLASFVRKVPIILTCHGSDILIDYKRSKIEKFFIKRAIENSDLITVPSRNMEQFITREIKKHLEIVVVQYGVRTKDFNYNFRITHPITGISTRQLEHKYRIDILLEALSMINKDINIKVKIIGDGSQRKTLQKKAEELSINNIVEFTGRVAHDEIAKHFEDAHIYITTSPSDGLSISLLEAFAGGCYPIVPDIPSNRELKRMGFFMEMYKVNDPNSLASTITSSCRNLNQAKNLIYKNRKLVEKHFDREKNLKEVEQLYYKLSQKGNHPQ